jgi:hypothetical protein
LKRKDISIFIGALPRIPFTMRTMSELAPRMGMKSISMTAKSGVSYVVSRMSVWSRYLRVVFSTSTAGASSQRPFSSVPSKRAKHASDEKSGQQSQSIDPSRQTSAAVWQSPMSA